MNLDRLHKLARAGEIWRWHVAAPPLYNEYPEVIELEASWKTAIWRQFGAAIDMLENGIVGCPEALWNDRSRRPEVWYLVYHTLFWLDLYLSESAEQFAPPEPFTLGELDPEGALPERVYTKAELLAYLDYGRRKCRAAIDALTNEKARRRFVCGRVDMSAAELLLYNMRHVQHGAGHLNLILRQVTDSAPPWVVETGDGRHGD